MKNTFAILLAIGLAAQAQITNVWMGSPTNNYATRDTYSNAWTRLNWNDTYFMGRFNSLADAQTNSTLQSPIVTVFTTNRFILNANRGSLSNLCTVTNFSDIIWNGQMWNTISNQSPATFTVVYSTNAGSSWITNWPNPMLGVITLGFMAQSPTNDYVSSWLYISNIVVRVMARPDLLNSTNQLYYQSVRVSQPTLDDEVTPKSYVDASVAAVNYMLNGGMYLSGSSLNLDGQWATFANTNGVQFTYLGTSVMSLQTPALSFGNITFIGVTNTVVYIRVQTNSVSSSPILQWCPNLTHQAWLPVSSVTNSYPTATGTNYLLSFPMITNQPTVFVRAAQVSTAPKMVTFGALLNSSPVTITNSTDSTYGYGAGVTCRDTNYIYVSVGTNLWKRAALSSW